MRAIFYVGTAVLVTVGLIVPAPAQMMCGPAQQAQAQGEAPRSGPGGMMMGGMGGMCGMMGQRTADDPMADNPGTASQQQRMMCTCCRNMTMMSPQQQQQPAQPRQ